MAVGAHELVDIPVELDGDAALRVERREGRRGAGAGGRRGRAPAGPLFFSLPFSFSLFLLFFPFPPLNSGSSSSLHVLIPALSESPSMLRVKCLDSAPALASLASASWPLVGFAAAASE